MMIRQLGNTKRYAIIGCAGYIAEKHLKAIKETNGELVYAHDLSDSVGILDKYFPNCMFTTKPRQFYKWLVDANLDYLVVCTPNHLHYEHVCLGLGTCKYVICEKPLVLKEKHFKELLKYNKRIYCILQLRISKQANKLRALVKKGHTKADVTYKVNRGHWYSQSWKANERKSGGPLFNIGIHIIDLMLFLGIDAKMDIQICNELKKEVRIADEVIDLSKGFTDLHTASYRDILQGNGWNPEDLVPVMEYLKNKK
jgi:UDP-N-acetyl-2-amino-2-deoxyglucuronate dehydrogenase